MQALILAAGRGDRMGSLTATKPKCMLEVGGRSLIRRQIDALRAHGVTDLTVVIGFGAEALAEHVGPGIRLVVNPRYAETNSLCSFSLGVQQVGGELLVLNADVLLDPVLLDGLLACPFPDVLLADLGDDLGEEEMKVEVSDGWLKDIARDLPHGSYDGENVGILKFGDAARRELSAIAGRLVEEGHEDAMFPLATRHLLRQRPIRVLATGGQPWIEIDFPDDLERAEREILPRLPALVRGPRPLPRPGAATREENSGWGH